MATANKVKDYATTLFAASDGTAAGLLKTRKEFDRWVSSQKGGRSFRCYWETGNS